MKKTLPLRLFIFLPFVCVNIAWTQIASTVVISEFASRGASSAFDEFIELYNPTLQDVDISNWKLQYKSASGTTWQDYVIIPAPNMIRAHGFFLLSNNSYGGATPSDVKWGANGIADNGHIRIVNAASAEIDRIGYGSAIDPKGSAAVNHGTTGNNNSVERKASSTSTSETLFTGGPEENAGNSYNTNNNGGDFVLQKNGRNPQNATSPTEPKSADGSGSASSIKKTARASDTLDYVIVFKPNPTDPVSAMKIVVPKDFGWSRNVIDVQFESNPTASISVIADSIFFEYSILTGDSVRITITSLIAPAQTGLHTFHVFTRGLARLVEIQTSPTLLIFGPAIPIVDARENEPNGVPKKLGQYVTVTGIVTVANQFGGPSYMQDATGGIAIFSQNFSQSVIDGDEVTITGKVDQFNGLTELIDITMHEKRSTGNAVAPLTVSIPQLSNDGANGVEVYEALLVKIANVSVNTNAWTVSGSGTNYRLNVGADAMDIRVDNNVDFANQPAPGGTFDIIGVVSQFKNASPYIGGYQLMARSKKDILATGPRITKNPFEKDIQITSVTLEWETQASSSSFVRYGKTASYENGIIGQADDVTTHRVTIASLEPATVYHAQVFSVAQNDTSVSQEMLFITRAQTSTGVMNVYFNKSVDQSLARGEMAKGNQNLLSRLVDRIASAKFTIDACLYSLSGSIGDAVAQALLDAKARGVSVRMIMENDNTSSIAATTLRNQIPFITDSYDQVILGMGLMHNKFFIIDGRERSSDVDDWVLTGSWNPTDNGTNDDAQNLIEVQDQALAVVYTMEFDEMWGSTTNTPDRNSSRFGSRKLDNTPHRISVKDVVCDSYFSPSDRTTMRIMDVLTKSTTSINFALLTFTRSDISALIKTRFTSGVKVRGVMDNNSDTGTQFGFFTTNGMDVHLKNGIAGLLHHKYAIIDQEKWDANTAVITGSHNWSNSAETSNNENTLIIHDGRIANLYTQEFAKRYTESGGTDKFVTDIRERLSVSDKEIYLDQNFPNPFSSSTTIRCATPVNSFSTVSNATLKIFDFFGREVIDLSQALNSGEAITVSSDRLPAPGMYYYRLVTPSTVIHRTMLYHP